jgi:hypothetical protein
MGRAMSGDDDTGGSGGTLPDNLFAPRQPREHEAPPGATPIGLGDASATAMPALLVPLLGDRPLSTAEDRIRRLRLLIEEFRQAGEAEIADALDNAVTSDPARGRGRPRKWTDDLLFALALDVGELLRAKPRLTGTSAISIIANHPRWRGRNPSTLRDHLTRYAARSGLTFEQAIDKLAAGHRSVS